MSPSSIRNDFRVEVRRKLALKFIELGAFGTAESLHPKIIEREKSGGRPERGFLTKTHVTEPSAPLSPFYLNLALAEDGGHLPPDIVNLIAGCMMVSAKAWRISYTGVTKLSQESGALASMFSKLALVQNITLGKTDQVLFPKMHQNVPFLLPVDGACMLSKEKIGAIEKLRSLGYAISDVVVLIDFDLGAHEAFSQINIYVEEKKITKYDRATISWYLMSLLM